MAEYTRSDTKKTQVTKQDQTYLELPDSSEKREAVRVVIAGQEVSSQDGSNSFLTDPTGNALITFIDTDTGGGGFGDITYIGKALPGTAESASAWQIKRINADIAGNVVQIQWADGNTDFDNQWSQRDFLSYS